MTHPTDQTPIQLRNQRIADSARAGRSLRELGHEYGLSYERVRKITISAGINPSQIREERIAAQRLAREQTAHQIREISLVHPEMTLDEVAKEAGTDTRTVRAALGPRRYVHETPLSRGGQGISDEELLAALRRWGAQTTSRAGRDFTAWAAPLGIPGNQTVAKRFTSWNRALYIAGLTPNTNTGGLRPVISEDELWASVLQFLQADLPKYSLESYSQYATTHHLPSCATILSRLGRWRDIRQRARGLMRYAAAPSGQWEWADRVLAVTPGQTQRNLIGRNDAVQALQSAASRVEGTLTIRAYEAARNPGDPEKTTIMGLFGSWVEALQAAGLGDRASRHAIAKLAA